MTPRALCADGSPPVRPHLTNMNLSKKLAELVRRIGERGHLVHQSRIRGRGTRSDELLRLLDVTRTCNVPLTSRSAGARR